MTYEGEPNSVAARIEFTHHVIKRKTNREDWLVKSNSYRDTRQKLPEMEAIMREKGKWYQKFDEDEGLIKYYCLINNLEVYCGILIENENVILITTYWPYTQKMKRRLFPRNMENFERIILQEEE